MTEKHEMIARMRHGTNCYVLRLTNSVMVSLVAKDRILKGKCASVKNWTVIGLKVTLSIQRDCASQIPNQPWNLHIIC